MDVVRTTKKRHGRLVAAAVIVAAAILVTLGLSRLQPAAQKVDRASLVIDTVRQGEMTRDVRGSGTLVPEQIQWITALTDGRIERLHLQPGAVVRANDVVLELTAPEQQQSAQDAGWQLRASEADLESLRATLETERLALEASLARLRAEAEQARLRAEADAELHRQGVLPTLTLRLSTSSADELARRVSLEGDRLRLHRATADSRLASQRAEVEQRRALQNLQQSRVASLQVRAGIDGVLQRVDVQVGQRVAAGTQLARVIDPNRLKGEIRIPETLSRDIALGQQARVEIGSASIPAHVVRFDPAVRDGSVTVDLLFDAPLPRGSRPDLTVDAVIELEKLPSTLFVARPVSARESSTAQLFRLTPDGSRAERTSVELGRASSSLVEVRRGLAAGEKVIVSDTSAFGDRNEIRLR
jgi:HlyD family secretion protein